MNEQQELRSLQFLSRRPLPAGGSPSGSWRRGAWAGLTSVSNCFLGYRGVGLSGSNMKGLDECLGAGLGWAELPVVAVEA